MKTYTDFEMETLEIHSKDFLVKWVYLPEGSSIVWQVKPLKRSINFGIYRKNDLPSASDSNSDASERPRLDVLPASGQLDGISPPAIQHSDSSQTTLSKLRLRSSSVASVNQITELSVYKTKSRASTFSSNLSNSDLTLVKNYYKLIPGELVKGTFEAPKGGMYAFIFDNSFSKTTSKKVFFSSKIVGGDDPVGLTRRVSTSKLYQTPNQSQTFPLNNVMEESTDNILRPKNGELMQSTLMKKRRKKLQGFTKRFFILNFKYGTLSYFKKNDNKLRGQMPILQSIVSANSKTREIFIDSGMEVWDLKALNKEDFNAWVKAFNAIKKTHFPEEGEIDGEQVDEPRRDGMAGLEHVQLRLKQLLRDSRGLSKDQLEIKILEITLSIQDIFDNQKSGGNDLSSITSNTEFFDAEDYHDSGVVFMDASNEKKTHSDEEQEDEHEASDTSSSESIESDDVPAPTSSFKEANGAISADLEDMDHSLYPLPMSPIERDADIPTCNHEPPSLISFVRKNVGKDLSSISMPVDMNEPLTILQKYAELVEYCEMIDNALHGKYPEDSGELILRIAAFSVSYLSTLRKKLRSSRKPFNPLLGETFELVREDKGFRLIGEKVSHKPPVLALFVEAADWTLSMTAAPSQKFWGKTSEISTKGTVKLTIRSTGEVFTWAQPTCLLKNILAGEKYTEPSSSVTVKSSSGQRAVVEFAKGGMFSGRSEDLTIKAFDASKKQLAYSVEGKWTESMTLKTNSTEKVIWTAGELLPNCEKKFGFTEFAGTLNKITPVEKGQLPPMDSRLRPDMQVYEKGEVSQAEKLKLKLEDGQRTRRTKLQESGDSHEPLFFQQVGGSPDSPDSGDWVYKAGPQSYWNRRNAQNWSGVTALW